MKYKISKQEFDALSDDVKALYKVNGDNYVIHIEGMPDVSAIQSQLDELKGALADAEKKKKDAEDKAELEKQSKLKKSGDVTALEESYNAKIAKMEAEHKELVSGLKKKLSDNIVGGAVSSLASKLCGEDAMLIEPFIKNRVSLDDDTGSLRILDEKGNPSASTIEDLEKEIRANDKFAKIINAGSSSGTGGNIQPEKSNDSSGGGSFGLGASSEALNTYKKLFDK